MNELIEGVSNKKLAAIVVIGIIVIGFGSILLGWMFGWGNKAVKVTGADNVETQYTQVIDTFNRVQAAANNACVAGKSSPQAGDPVLIERPEVAYGATVRSQVVDYNRRQANIFEAKLVGPAGYPKALPTPSATQDWCTYAADVAALRN